VKSNEPIVYLVDDDAALRDAVADLLASVGIETMAFGSASEYKAAVKRDAPSCLILDIELPDINGLDFQQQMTDGEHPPVVFITGHGDIPSSVRAMKAGAVDFLPKPFSQDALVGAIKSAMARHKESRQRRSEISALREKYSLLTPREREVFTLVVSGLLNKQSASKLGISAFTFQIHRGQVMRKMAATSLSDLVRMSEKLGNHASGG
jgi:FixJ family two-component response regulator